MNKILAIYLLAFFIFSCTTKQEFIILRDVPTNPTFVVVPANNRLYQVEFANKVESSLLGVGVSVLQRPSVKEVRTEQNFSESESQERDSRKIEEATLIEAYTAYEGLEADYLITTYAISEQVRIIKMKTNEVVASFEIVENAPPGENSSTILGSIEKSLKSMGVITN